MIDIKICSTIIAVEAIYPVASTLFTYAIGGARYAKWPMASVSPFLEFDMLNIWKEFKTSLKVAESGARNETLSFYNVTSGNTTYERKLLDRKKVAFPCVDSF